MKLRAAFALLTIALAFGCNDSASGQGAPGSTDCASDLGTFVFTDEQCGGLAHDGGASCNSVGDGQTYSRCASDADCCGTTPHCAVVGLYAGGDYNCNATVRVCMHEPRRDCAVE